MEKREKWDCHSPAADKRHFGRWRWFPATSYSGVAPLGPRPPTEWQQDRRVEAGRTPEISAVCPAASYPCKQPLRRCAWRSDAHDMFLRTWNRRRERNRLTRDRHVPEMKAMTRDEEKLWKLFGVSLMVIFNWIIMTEWWFASFTKCWQLGNKTGWFAQLIVPLCLTNLVKDFVRNATKKDTDYKSLFGIIVIYLLLFWNKWVFHNVIT